jgi:DNA-binding transcriptional ArsR family regulator
MPTIGAAPTPATSTHDYAAADTLVLDAPEQLRALADDVRTAVVALLRERAFSTQQLAEKLGIPKGTVGHHLKVLEQAGLIRVVRTRKVRAMTEKFYGRTAHLFLFKTEDPDDTRALGGSVLRRAANEVERAPEITSFGHPKVKLTREDVDRFERRVKRLTRDLLAADSPDGTPYAFVGALYQRPDA